jgi:hypothetical protein
VDSAGDRVLAVRQLVAGEPAGGSDAVGVAEWLHRLCRVALHELPASGAGVSLMDGGGLGGVAAASDPTCRALEELQFTLGEGPCVDAHAWRRPVLEPDLRVVATLQRWPGYAPAAYEAGVRAVFAFPLQVGAARLGVLDVHRRRPGSLSAESLTRALTFAEVAVQQILDGQAHAADGLAADGLAEALGYRHVVYQAQGMVMAHLGGSLVDAMARLRAHAYTTDRLLTDVARDVVAGKLRLEPDGY